MPSHDLYSYWVGYFLVPWHGTDHQLNNPDHFHQCQRCYSKMLLMMVHKVEALLAVAVPLVC
jgi:hypothetical protein